MLQEQVSGAEHKPWDEQADESEIPKQIAWEQLFPVYPPLQEQRGTILIGSMVICINPIDPCSKVPCSIFAPTPLAYLPPIVKNGRSPTTDAIG